MGSILIVEDDRIIALDMADTLKGSGYEVEIAGDGEEGLEKVKQKPYGLIISDCNLPRMNGEQFYTEVLALDKGLAKRVIFVCAELNDFIRSTGNTCLVKPYSYDQLLETVKRLIPAEGV